MRAPKIPPLTRDADGKPLCRGCQGPVPPRRRSWCSDECVERMLIQSNPAHARRRVEERDKGVCACCGIDTEKIRITLMRLANMASAGVHSYDRIQAKISRRLDLNPKDLTHVIGFRHMEHGPIPPWVDRARRIDRRLKGLARARIKSMKSRLRDLGFHGLGYTDTSHTESLWQADHILPVEHGGGGCGLDNFQTLCIPCHKRKTRQQAQARKIARRLFLNPHLIPPPP